MRIQTVIQLAAVCLIVSFATTSMAAEPAGPSPERLERLFRNLDRNGDGRIDLDEFVDRAPQAHRQMREGSPRLPQSEARQPHREEIERRINEMIERRVNEILDRRIHEFVEERLPRIIEERMQCPLGRGPMSDRGPMARVYGRDRDRPEFFKHDWDRDRDRPGRPSGRGWACQPPGPGWEKPGMDRPKGEWRGPRPDQGRRRPRGWGADRQRRGPNQRPLFRMFDADHDGKIQAEEVDRLANKMREKLGLQEGGEITLEDWDRIARERVEQRRKERTGEREKKREGERERGRG